MTVLNLEQYHYYRTYNELNTLKMKRHDMNDKKKEATFEGKNTTFEHYMLIMTLKTFKN